MFDDFDKIKAQLIELAPAINAFKSETVQVRIVELMFKQQDDNSRAERQETSESRQSRGGGSPRKKNIRTKTKAAGRPAEGTAPQARKIRSSAGPVVVLGELVGAQFFSERRTLNQIIDHCRSGKAKIFRPDQLSGPLARFVRDGRLERAKNSDGQYEYWK